jgi:DNA-binding XRE family transcriptional regulator
MGTIYTKKDLMKALGVSHQTLITWEKRGIIPRPENKKTVAKLYTEDEFNKIVALVQDIREHPENYSLSMVLKKETKKRPPQGSLLLVSAAKRL